MLEILTILIICQTPTYNIANTFLDVVANSQCSCIHSVGG